MPVPGTSGFSVAWALIGIGLSTFVITSMEMFSVVEVSNSAQQLDRGSAQTRTTSAACVGRQCAFEVQRVGGNEVRTRDPLYVNGHASMGSCSVSNPAESEVEWSDEFSRLGLFEAAGSTSRLVLERYDHAPVAYFETSAHAGIVHGSWASLRVCVLVESSWSCPSALSVRGQTKTVHVGGNMRTSHGIDVSGSLRTEGVCSFDDQHGDACEELWRTPEQGSILPPEKYRRTRVVSLRAYGALVLNNGTEVVLNGRASLYVERDPARELGSSWKQYAQWIDSNTADTPLYRERYQPLLQEDHARSEKEADRVREQVRKVNLTVRQSKETIRERWNTLNDTFRPSVIHKLEKWNASMRRVYDNRTVFQGDLRLDSTRESYFHEILMRDNNSLPGLERALSPSGDPGSIIRVSEDGWTPGSLLLKMAPSGVVRVSKDILFGKDNRSMNSTIPLLSSRAEHVAGGKTRVSRMGAMEAFQSYAFSPERKAEVDEFDSAVRKKLDTSYWGELNATERLRVRIQTEAQHISMLEKHARTEIRFEKRDEEETQKTKQFVEARLPRIKAFFFEAASEIDAPPHGSSSFNSYRIEATSESLGARATERMLYGADYGNNLGTMLLALLREYNRTRDTWGFTKVFVEKAEHAAHAHLNNTKAMLTNSTNILNDTENTFSKIDRDLVPRIKEGNISERLRVLRTTFLSSLDDTTSSASEMASMLWYHNEDPKACNFSRLIRSGGSVSTRSIGQCSRYPPNDPFQRMATVNNVYVRTNGLVLFTDGRARIHVFDNVTSTGRSNQRRIKTSKSSSEQTVQDVGESAQERLHSRVEHVRRDVRNVSSSYSDEDSTLISNVKQFESTFSRFKEKLNNALEEAKTDERKEAERMDTRIKHIKAGAKAMEKAMGGSEHSEYLRVFKVSPSFTDGDIIIGSGSAGESDTSRIVLKKDTSSVHVTSLHTPKTVYATGSVHVQDPTDSEGQQNTPSLRIASIGSVRSHERDQGGSVASGYRVARVSVRGNVVLGEKSGGVTLSEGSDIKLGEGSLLIGNGTTSNPHTVRGTVRVDGLAVYPTISKGRVTTSNIVIDEASGGCRWVAATDKVSAFGLWPVGYDPVHDKIRICPVKSGSVKGGCGTSNKECGGHGSCVSNRICSCDKGYGYSTVSENLCTEELSDYTSSLVCPACYVASKGRCQRRGNPPSTESGPICDASKAETTFPSCVHSKADPMTQYTSCVCEGTHESCSPTASDPSKCKSCGPKQVCEKGVCKKPSVPTPSSTLSASAQSAETCISGVKASTCGGFSVHNKNNVPSQRVSVSHAKSIMTHKKGHAKHFRDYFSVDSEVSRAVRCASRYTHFSEWDTSGSAYPRGYHAYFPGSFQDQTCWDDDVNGHYVNNFYDHLGKGACHCAECKENWSGYNCDCNDEITCHGHGKCVIQKETARPDCVCEKGYTGDTCEFPVVCGHDEPKDECASVCGPGGDSTHGECTCYSDSEHGHWYPSRDQAKSLGASPSRIQLCSKCAPGYGPPGSCTHAEPSCGRFGARLEDWSGCECMEGYSGPACQVCPVGTEPPIGEPLSTGHVATEDTMCSEGEPCVQGVYNEQSGVCTCDNNTLVRPEDNRCVTCLPCAYTPVSPKTGQKETTCSAVCVEKGQEHPCRNTVETAKSLGLSVQTCHGACTPIGCRCKDSHAVPPGCDTCERGYTKYDGTQCVPIGDFSSIPFWVAKGGSYRVPSLCSLTIDGNRLPTWEGTSGKRTSMRTAPYYPTRLARYFRGSGKKDRMTNLYVMLMFEGSTSDGSVDITVLYITADENIKKDSGACSFDAKDYDAWKNHRMDLALGTYWANVGLPDSQHVRHVYKELKNHIGELAQPSREEMLAEWNPEYRKNPKSMHSEGGDPIGPKQRCRPWFRKYRGFCTPYLVEVDNRVQERPHGLWGTPIPVHLPVASSEPVFQLVVGPFDYYPGESWAVISTGKPWNLYPHNTGFSASTTHSDPRSYAHRHSKNDGFSLPRDVGIYVNPVLAKAVKEAVHKTFEEYEYMKSRRKKAHEEHVKREKEENHKKEVKKEREENTKREAEERKKHHHEVVEEEHHKSEEEKKRHHRNVLEEGKKAAERAAHKAEEDAKKVEHTISSWF